MVCQTLSRHRWSDVGDLDSGFVTKRILAVVAVKEFCCSSFVEACKDVNGSSSESESSSKTKADKPGVEEPQASTEDDASSPTARFEMEQNKKRLGFGDFAKKAAAAAATTARSLAQVRFPLEIVCPCISKWQSLVNFQSWVSIISIQNDAERVDGGVDWKGTFQGCSGGRSKTGHEGGWIWRTMRVSFEGARWGPSLKRRTTWCNIALFCFPVSDRQPCNPVRLS